MIILAVVVDVSRLPHVEHSLTQVVQTWRRAVALPEEGHSTSQAKELWLRSSPLRLVAG
jgi:hypothetical protein